jgi:carbamoyl-phosphate synthase small subunit
VLNLKQLQSSGYDAILLLQSGEIFYGNALGKKGTTTGELCFITALTGYQHTITDPSFAEQIITFTFPHIGNVGVNNFDNESKKIFCKGIILREKVVESDHFLRLKSFSTWLNENNIIAITGVDTRKLVHIINKKGPQNAIICSDQSIDNDQLKAILSRTPNMESMELTKIVSGFHLNINEQLKKEKKVAIIDFGIKDGIINNISKYFNVEIIKSELGFSKKISNDIAGIVLSNGPGDPIATFDYLNHDINEIFSFNIPILGICLGHQIIALKFDCRTNKMDIGHRGANHPVLNLETNKVEITSQNHGFVVDKDTLSNQVEVTHISLFDNSIEGLQIKNKPIFSVQYHPEGSPGPNDSIYIFEKFFNVVNN